MPLYPFQERVFELVLGGQSVVLQAPTGAGKTRAALYPFLRAWEYGDPFPRKCIYSVPLRVLANQFWQEYEQRARHFGFRRPLHVTIQTGDRPEDPKLEGNLIFSTIDQTLSNFLSIPYGLSMAQGNLNAAAVLSSYLVFDELHLFDPATMLPTTLHLLRMLRGIVPFLVMTATLSEEMVQAVASELDAVPLVLSPGEAAELPSQHKTRRVHTVEKELGADAVLGLHQRRSVAICNTIDRAQALFQEVSRLANSGTEVRLLHSRFLREDRTVIEDWLQREFGKDKGAYTVPSAILIATQVIEVGLDITSEVLHSELAPAASIIQRAGRCARYQAEMGDVCVYRLPADEKGEPRCAPYTGIQARICKQTWEALASCSGQTVDFGAELALVNQAHGETDRQVVEGLRATRFYVADRIAQVIEGQERGAARELIRTIDSRTVIVHPEPKTIENPWSLEGFGIFRGSLYGAFEDLERVADELDEDWILMAAEPLPEEESGRERTVWCWRHIADKEDLSGALIVAVNPRLAQYDARAGFRLGVAGEKSWQSPALRRTQREHSFPPYQRETFQEHVGRMLHVFKYPFFDPVARQERLALAEELAYASSRIEARFGWAQGTLDRLARLIIAVHDVGKLDQHWQAWARQWQEELSVLRGADFALPRDYLAAHTDYDERDSDEKALNQKLRRGRPNHAAEGAAAAMDWLLEWSDDQSLARAALTSIARHHSAGASGRHGPFNAHRMAAQALMDALDAGELRGEKAPSVRWSLPQGDLSRHMVRPKRERELLPYLLLARALRLADQRSQQLPAST